MNTLKRLNRNLLLNPKIKPVKFDQIIDEMNEGMDLVQATSEVLNTDPMKLAEYKLSECRPQVIQYKLTILYKKHTNFFTDQEIKELIELKIVKPESLTPLLSTKGKYEFVKRAVYGQDHAIEHLLEHFNEYDAYWRALKNDANAIRPFGFPFIVGPTGCGKTYLIETIAKMYDCNLFKIDASRLTMEGYVGLHFGEQIKRFIEDCEELSPNRKGETPEAHRIIVLIDEFDKVSNLYNQHSEYKGVGLLNEMLPFFDQSNKTVHVKESSSGSSYHESSTIDIASICYVFAGAFSQLYEKDQSKSVGFHYNRPMSTPTLDVTELYPREISGRIGRPTYLNVPSKEIMFKLLDSEHNPEIVYQKQCCNQMNIPYEFSDTEKEQIVNDTLNKKTGFRGLRSELSQLLREERRRLHFHEP